MHPSELTDDERRVLSNGPLGSDDYPIVGRLIAYGFTDSHCVLSKRRDSYGQIASVQWAGPNASGMLALERRLACAPSNDANLRKYIHCKNHPANGKKSIPERLRGFFAEAIRDSLAQVVAALLLLLIGLMLYRQFGISIK